MSGNKAYVISAVKRKQINKEGEQNDHFEKRPAISTERNQGT